MLKSALLKEDAAAPEKSAAPVEHFDVVIVGAGLSGIGAACRLRAKCPAKSFVILEERNAIGGTWDLFRYPGVRSDSDMPTFGFRFRPWDDKRAIAEGPAILRYLRETAEEHGVDRLIRFGCKVLRASWRSDGARWILEATGPAGTSREIAADFLYVCTGYYEYEGGYMPGWPGMGRFAGRIVHPQEWPEDLAYESKRVVVIGSGATAVTLVPAMAERATHVVMLQRSPTYVVSRPADDAIAEWLRRWLPAGPTHALVRWKNILRQMYLYSLCRRKPGAVRAALMKLAQQELGPGIDAGVHFAPRYNPWDQRVCLVPDGDLFAAMRLGKASVVTDEIETFTEKGLQLRSGCELEADIIVTATGLKMRLMGGMAMEVDGESVDFATRTTYKGMMFSDVPNLASAMGYINASWTLKADLIADSVCRLLNHMDRKGYDVCTPRMRGASNSDDAFFPLESGYALRARPLLPRQGARKPWRINNNYVRDLLAFRFGAVEDGEMEFRRRGAS
jgi:monooxygenase